MAYPAVRRIERAARLPLAGLCAWEALALVTGLVPTVTQACRAHRRWLMPAAVAVLAAHIWFAPLRPARVSPAAGPGSAAAATAAPAARIVLPR